MATPDVDGYEVKTCNVDEFDGMWWDFDTDNTIANTFVPAYKGLLYACHSRLDLFLEYRRRVWVL